MHKPSWKLALALSLCFSGTAFAQTRAENIATCKANEAYMAAVKACTALIAANAKDADAYYWRSLVYLKDSNRQRATADIDLAVKLAPAKAKAYREEYDRQKEAANEKSNAGLLNGIGGAF